MRLKHKIALTVFVLEALLVAYVLTLSLEYATRRINEQFEASETLTMGLLSKLSLAALLTENFDDLQTFIVETPANPRILAVVVRDIDGVVVASALPPSLMENGATVLQDVDAWRWQSIEGQTQKVGTLGVAFTDAPLREAVTGAWQVAIVAALSGILLSAMIAIWLGERMTRRLELLADQAANVRLGSTFSLAPFKGGGEVARLAEAFAKVLDELQARMTDLASARDQLALPTEAMSQGFAVWDADNRLVLCNSRLKTMLPQLADRLNQGLAFSAFTDGVASAGVESAQELLCRWMEARQHGAPSLHVELANGRHLQIHESATGDGGVVAIFTDVTEERRQSAELIRSETHRRQVMEAVFDGLLTVDAEGQVRQANAAAERLFGYRTDDLVGSPLRALFDMDSSDEGAFASLAPDRRARSREVTGRHRDGGTFPVEIGLAQLDDRSGEGLCVVTVRDISERKEREAVVVYQATHDTLTGLLNRLTFNDRLNRLIAKHDHSQRLAVFFVDIDHFKRLNDVLGHDVGDMVLREMAQRFGDWLPDGGLAARMGGDEFLFACPNVRNVAHGLELANDLLSFFAKPLAQAGQSLHLAGSVGLALFPEHGRTVEQLVKGADLALYAAKRAGRGRARIFDPTIHLQAGSPAQLSGQLRQALDNGEFRAALQPDYDLRSGEPVCLEMLLRWQSFERGTVPAADFVPVATESGLIAGLSESVWPETFKRFANLQATDPSQVQLSLNIAAQQLYDRGFLERLQTGLAAAGLRPERVHIEIDESTLTEAGPALRGPLEAITDVGFGLVIDDFGRGSAALGMLTRFPVTGLKLAARMTQAACEEAPSAALIRSTVGMAHGLGLWVTAKGIETPAQLATVQRLGCDRGQGYHLARPIDAGLIEHLRLGVPGTLKPAANSQSADLAKDQKTEDRVRPNDPLAPRD